MMPVEVLYLNFKALYWLSSCIRKLISDGHIIESHFWKILVLAVVFFCIWDLVPTSIYLLKVNNRNTKTICEVWSVLTIKTKEQRYWNGSGVCKCRLNMKHLNLFCATLWASTCWESTTKTGQCLWNNLKRYLPIGTLFSSTSLFPGIIEQLRDNW